MDPQCLVATDYKTLSLIGKKSNMLLYMSLDGLLQKYNTLFNNKYRQNFQIQSQNFAEQELHLTHCAKQLRTTSSVYSNQELLQVSSTVIVPKLDGSVRICGDFKSILQIDKHLILKPEDLLTVLAGG